jgi:hypothetical protein
MKSFVKYFYNNEINDDEMGGACSMHEMKIAYKISVAMSYGKRPPGRIRCR